MVSLRIITATDNNIIINTLTPVTPAVFVCVSAAMKKDFFERVDDEDFCWLAYDMWPKWLFVGPSVLIIAISVILLFKTLTASLKMKSSLGMCVFLYWQ